MGSISVWIMALMGLSVMWQPLWWLETSIVLGSWYGAKRRERKQASVSGVKWADKQTTYR